MKNTYKKIIITLFAFAVLTVGVQLAQADTYTSDLTLGNSGPQVVALQTWLESNGYLIMPQGVAKGYFGAMTRAALASYQKSIGLPAYGFFGPMTRERLNRGDNSAGALNVISPNGGENWQWGTTQTIRWNSPKYFRATTVDIRIVQFSSPCTFGSTCILNAPQPFSFYLARNINANDNSYSWNVGNVINANSSLQIPDGQYIVQICEFGMNVCASSKRPFTITSQVADSRAPVINSFSAPTSLTVGQIGTWTVNARDPQNGTLSYSITWGDENTQGNSPNLVTSSPVFTQNTSFTHTYLSAGTYTVRLTVRNSAGLNAQSSATVNVTGSTSYGSVKVISPNGFEILKKNSIVSITWNPVNISGNVDISLIPKSACSLVPCFAPPPPGSTSPLLNLTAYIAKNISNSGSYSWDVGKYTYSSSVMTAPDGEYQVMVCVANVCDTSDAYFSISTATGQNPITVLSPNGGENWLANSVHQIMWSNPSATYGSKVDLYLERVVVCAAIYPVPASCYPAPIVLDKNIDTNSVYNWIVGTDVSNNLIPAGEYTLKICSAGTNNCDNSNSVFTITSALLQICPTTKITNVMPSTGISSVPTTYYILNNQRREINEFDTNWVTSHCSVPNQIVN